MPAVMALAGRRIWYHPQWFDDHVPDLDIEGDQLEPGKNPKIATVGYNCVQRRWGAGGDRGPGLGRRAVLSGSDVAGRFG
jgi:hypothetical protein